MPLGGFGSLEIVFALALLAPGFLTLALIGRLRGASRFLGTDLQNAVLSVALSGIILTLLASFHSLHSLDALTSFILAHPLRSVGEVVALVFGLSVLIGVGLLLNPVQRIANLLHLGQHVVPVGFELWDVFLSQNELRPVEVQTQEGEIYKGFLAGYSHQGERPAIHISPAIEVDYASTPPEDVHLGDQMLLWGADIAHVTVLSGEEANLESG